MTVVDHPVLVHVPPAGSASVRGPRRTAADATAVRGHGPGLVAVVADGIGDSPAAARAARIAADTAAAVAPGGGSLQAVLAAGAAVRADPRAADTVLVVAAWLPGGGYTASWVGDCRALLWDGATLRQLTHDHTCAEVLRAMGVADPGFANVVTSTAATAGPAEVGHVVGPAGGGTLVLLSDGVHRAVTPDVLVDVLRRPAPPAATAHALVTAALDAGTRDNATALVVPLPVEWTRPSRASHRSITAHTQEARAS